MAVKGAILLPGYDYARAHHNKIYMELLKTEFKNPELKSIRTRFYGSACEAIDAKDQIEYPVIVKIADGAAGRGVILAHDADEYVKRVRKICKGRYYTSYYDLFMKTTRKVLAVLGIKKYKIDKYYGKIIAQTFIPGLSGDYKVLYFGGKYYTLKRLNRKNDFRASGSGIRLPVPEDEVEGLLDFAKKVVKEIDFTIIGMDIGFDGTRYHLLEFQMIHLGPYTLSRSEYYHVEKDGHWEKITGKSDLEEEFCRSIDLYIKENPNE